jgi:tRNA pseudouridine32 synthase/23S rRNA pseudouridine746 synthase
MSTPPIVVVFENDHFIVCDKPCGVLTVPERSAESGRRVLGLELQNERGIQIYPVHRLDYVVSGLVLFAMNAEAHRVANGWFEQHQVRKTYRAWTHTQDFSHIPAQVATPRKAITLTVRQAFEWRGRIKRGKRRAFESPDGQPSITHATYLGRVEATDYLAWDLEPITGRPHQLRLDLSRHGFPIVGDGLYGSPVDLGPNRIALRAYRLSFAQIGAEGRLGLPDQIETDALPVRSIMSNPQTP